MKNAAVLASLLASLGLAVVPDAADACDFFFTSVLEGNCASCHGAPPNTTITCNGCHRHGVHDSGGAMNLRATTRQRFYAPGQTVQVTMSGGYRSGWFRSVLRDQNGLEVARNTGTVKAGAVAPSGGPGFPATLSAPAPTAPGTYIWTAGWYGNQFDRDAWSKFGRWVEDANNPNHGYELVDAVIVVTDQLAPLAAFAPGAATPLTLQATPVGGSVGAYLRISNVGNADLHLTSFGPCAASSPEFTATLATPAAVAPGAALLVPVTYRPTDVGADRGCFAVATDDPAASTAEMTVTATGLPGTDLDFTAFTATARATVARKPTISLNVSVRNVGAVDQYYLAELVGRMGTAEVYRQSMTVYDLPGDSTSTVFPFPAFQATAPGTITWTVTMSDADPDSDARSATTTVSR